MSFLRASLLFLVVIPLLAACGPSVGTLRMGPVVAARPLDCSLELIDAAPSAGIPPGLELLGYVQVKHEEGKSPNDPDVLKLVKPEACKLGGEQVSAGMSMNVTNGIRSNSMLTFMVWHKKGAAAGPVKF
jgi:hypothetical protein